MPFNKKDYPPNWSEIRARILKRADNKCEICGVPNYALIHRFDKGKDDWVYWPEGMESDAWDLDGLKCTKIILTTAHLDHDKSNHNVTDDRLQALCQKCHLSLDMKQHVSNRINNKHKNNLKLF